MPYDLQDLKQLPLVEQERIVGELLSNIAEQQAGESFSEDEALQNLLEDRMGNHLQHPDASIAGPEALVMLKKNLQEFSKLYHGG
jgi:hypothetical protein